MTSDQHMDVTAARQARDDKDMRSILAYLQSRRPFERDSSPQNIATRIIADRSVNAEKAKEVRSKIIESMQGNNVHEYTFKKKEMVRQKIMCKG